MDALLCHQFSAFVIAAEVTSSVYVDGDAGDDCNDGLSPAFPVRTINRAMGMLPDVVNQDITVHLTGTFTDVAEGVTVTLDGGSTVVLDDISWELAPTAEPPRTQSTGYPPPFMRRPRERSQPLPRGCRRQHRRRM